MELKLKVSGMSCEGCENRVKNAVLKIEGVREVTASHKSGEVVISLDKEISKDVVVQKIEALGYEVSK